MFNLYWINELISLIDAWILIICEYCNDSKVQRKIKAYIRYESDWEYIYVDNEKAQVAKLCWQPRPASWSRGCGSSELHKLHYAEPRHARRDTVSAGDAGHETRY